MSICGGTFFVSFTFQTIRLARSISFHASGIVPSTASNRLYLGSARRDTRFKKSHSSTVVPHEQGDDDPYPVRLLVPLTYHGG
ncbi:uncharacterized protein FOMMEDRAFT_151065 [Fomitiporia mediterranea MF3/22]|uniref:uncharacterized protein n=1 Tax=Fomitiporia mediterranea (strain MF3/22) TaxID=694068 RepID=UPI0004409211|nr:uncharacterized protein FOMMEDRAFT_151065 [Fomitiporia mediterranea MF3/22]EJD08303.1 hypothetical protein FOMMEDRAFT_151065 [Fomitiporia mediterranea MF3/22]